MSPHQLPEPYESLAGALRSAADRLDATEAAAGGGRSRRRRLARWARGHVPLVLVGAIALTGTAAATVGVLGGEPSKPMSGPLAGSPSLGPQHYRVRVRPGSAVGMPTWCVDTVVRTEHEQGTASSGCLPVRGRRHPLLGGGISGGDERGDGALYTQVTTDDVAAIVMPTGRRVLTRRDPELPGDLRIAVTRFDRHENWQMRHPRKPRTDGRSIVTPLDDRGRPLSAAAPDFSNPQIDITTHDGTLDVAGAPCGFSRARELEPLAPTRLAVPADRLPTSQHLAGDPLVACAQLTIGPTNTVAPRTATIYVNANHPGAEPAWPGTTRRRGRTYAPGSGLGRMALGTDEQLVERRGNAWLAIDGATPAEAIRLMRELRIRVDL
ncbi:MAG: hypothetical protein PGN13_04610 [Patulibacter minatonensis]